MCRSVRPSLPRLSQIGLVAAAWMKRRRAVVCGMSIATATLASACVTGAIGGADDDPAGGSTDGGHLPAPHPHADTGGDPSSTLDDDAAAPPPPANEDASPPPPSSSDDAAPPPPAADAAPPPPATGYPSGPYGLSVGQVFPNLSFQGYRSGVGAWTTLTMQEYYDPTGARRVNGLYLDVSASWCGACRAEAADLPSLYSSTYKSRGARILTALIQDSSSSPATPSTVDEWDKTFSINFDIVVDGTESTLPSGGGVGLPHNYVIDPRTMKVVKIVEGADPGATSIPGLDAVLSKNGG